jgi:dihydroflavonol-4-reductase
VSTAGVHGHVPKLPSDETAPYNPGDIYQESKLAGERVAQEAIKRGEPVSIVRPTGIYGPGDMRYFKLFKMIHRRRFIMFGSGETYHHASYVQDIADGIILCGTHPAAEGEVFIIGGDEYVTLNELTSLIAEAVGSSPPTWRLPMWPLLTAAKICESICVPLRIEPPLHTRRCEFFIKDRGFTVAKAKRMLGFEPKVPLLEGLRRTAAWYFQQGLLKGVPPADTQAVMTSFAA